MIVAIASGKGGTGKTSLAVSLALTAPADVRLLDCDVEEPNAHLLLDARLDSSRPVMVPVPLVDAETCTGCGECSAACAFNALACMGGPPLLFPDLCHGCGACVLACPAGALDETGREVGLIEWGEVAGQPGLELVRGSLRLGEARAVPVIEAVRAHGTPASLDLLDCPPGTACPFVAAVRGVDAVILVTEPTPFGLSDLEQAVETVRLLGTPCGVVVNRAGSGDDRVATYCRREDLPILLEIPDSRRIAEAYAHGRPAVLADPGLAAALEGLHRTLAAGSLRPLPARLMPPTTTTHTDLPGAWP